MRWHGDWVGKKPMEFKILGMLNWNAPVHQAFKTFYHRNCLKHFECFVWWNIVFNCNAHCSVRLCYCIINMQQSFYILQILSKEDNHIGNYQKLNNDIGFYKYNYNILTHSIFLVCIIRGVLHKAEKVICYKSWLKFHFWCRNPLRLLE